MTLPRKGDRVRVTEALYQPSLVGRELTLTHDAHWYDDTQTSTRFRCDEAGYVGPVKVEILELASTRECAQCSPVFTEEPAPCAICKGTRKVPRGKLDGFTPEQCAAMAAEEQAGFARGMRRAVEIAERVSFKTGSAADPGRRALILDAFQEEIEKELRS